jgi:hypothetical protein
MTATEITGTIAIAVIGSGGVVGLFFYFIRRYIEKKLNTAEELKAQEKKERQERRKVTMKLQYANGRLLFWMHRAIVKGEHNGELEDAFSEYQKAEAEQKAIEQEIVSRNNEDG